MTQPLLDRYFSALKSLAEGTRVTGAEGTEVTLAAATERAIEAMRACHDAGNALMFIGNGGSAGIASHLAIDYSKNGGLRARAFSDAAALTCLANDLGYEQVYAKQVEMHARPGDILIAISSGGRSPNILAAASQARRSGCRLLTFSGFTADNPLRHMGELNFYVASDQYGFVEVLHLTLLHAILDLHCGWQGDIRAPRG